MIIFNLTELDKMYEKLKNKIKKGDGKYSSMRIEIK